MATIAEIISFKKLRDMEKLVHTDIKYRTMKRSFIPNKIESPRVYYLACRSLCRKHGIHFTKFQMKHYLDIGWNRETPNAWIVHGRLQKFVDYVNECTYSTGRRRSIEHLTPEKLYGMMKSGIPSVTVRALAKLGMASKIRFTGLTSGRFEKLGSGELNKLKLAAVAANRISMKRGTKISFSQLVKLGKFSPEMQRIIIKSQPGGVFAYRSINWDLVSKIHNHMVSDKTGRVRLAYSSGARRKTLFDKMKSAGIIEDNGLSSTMSLSGGYMCPSYPKATQAAQAHIVRGMTPVEIASRDGIYHGGPFTAVASKKEAHEWLLESEGIRKSFISWLLEKNGIPPHMVVRNFHIARWLIDIKLRGDWNVLMNTRDIMTPEGRIECSYSDILDEITERDLVNGSSTSIHTAFQSCFLRRNSSKIDALKDHRKIQDLPPRWRLYNRCMKHLNTRSLLMKEGMEMHHCVGGYDYQVSNNESIILSITILDQRSTVEIVYSHGFHGKSDYVSQHRGKYNADPSELCKKVLSHFMKYRRGVIQNKEGE